MYPGKVENNNVIVDLKGLSMAQVLNIVPLQNEVPEKDTKFGAKFPNSLRDSDLF